MKFHARTSSSDVLDANTNYTSLIPSQLLTTTGAQKQHKHNEHWGHSLGPKEPHTLRVYFQNIHGIKLGEDSKSTWIDYQDKLRDMEALDVDVVGWAETNVTWNPALTANAKRHARNIFKQVHLTVSSSSEPSPTQYQMGGTLTGTLGKTTGRVIDSGTDPSGMGRWSYVCISGKQGRKVYVATAYRVAANDKGENTAYLQQYRAMKKKEVLKPDPRQQWIKDLSKEIKKWKKDGEVLLAVDINSPLLDRPVSKFLTDCGLCDILGTTHGVESPNTQISGSQTIDFLFATPPLFESVQKCGMLSFHDGIVSDHRGLWVDLNLLLLLRGEIHDISRPRQKKISTKQVKRANTFKSKVAEAIDSKDLVARTQHALELTHTMERDKCVEIMQQLDKEMDDAILGAEEEMTPLPDYWWSDTLHHSHLKVKFWSAVVSLNRNQMDTPQAIEELKRGISSEIDLYQGDHNRRPMTQLRRALRERKLCRTDSFKLRQAYLERLAEDEAAAGNSSKESILRRMKTAEATKRMYRLLRQYLKPEDRSGLTHILVPDRDATHLMVAAYLWMDRQVPNFNTAVLLSSYFMETTPTETIAKVMPHRRITTKEEMDSHLLAHHRKHFNQAQGTPFTVPPLSELIDFNASSPFCDAMRQGDANIDELDVEDDVKEYLEELQTHECDPPPIDTEYSMEHLIQGFKIWNENTSTSPLGRYLSIYKVWIDKKGKVDKKGHNFFKVILNILLLAMALCEPLLRWATVHNLFMTKAAGDYRIGRLRTIHKIDAELNGHRREFVARRLMRHAEKHDHLADEQFGGRYGRTASDVTLLSALTTEAFTLQRANAALTDCDAKACYDRILPQLVSLTAHKAGLPFDICRLYTKTLFSMEYSMITGFGESADTNKSTEDNTIFGPGQGAADAPADWTLISTSNTKVYNKKAKGCSIADPPKRRVLKRNADLFVDDVKLLHNSERFNISSNELKHQIQHDSTLWGRLLWISGGLLEFDKSTYTIILWRFQPNGAPEITSGSELDQSEVIIDANGERIVLKFTEASTALKMLGVRQAGTQQSTDEHQHMLGKTVKFSAAITACPLRQHEVLRGYLTVYLPSIKYSLAATCLTTKQCQSLDDIVLPKVARKLGFSSSFPSAVITAPTYFGGMGLQTIEGEQAVEKICATIKHVRADNQVGTLFHITLAWAQLQAGVSQPILLHPRRYCHLEGRWINTLLNDLETINGKIYIADPWIPPLQRENDQFIMEGIINCLQVDSAWHKEINYVRLFLRAMTLADISTSDGRKINPNLLTTAAKRLHSIFSWPQQERPHTPSWKKWQKAIQRTFCVNGWKLKIPLGKWLVKPGVTTWYSPNHHSVFTHSSDCWEVAPVTKQDRHHLSVGRSYASSQPTSILLPLPDFINNKATIPLGYATKEESSGSIHSFQAYISSLHAWERGLLTQLIETTTYMNLSTAVNLGEDIWLVTDGGKTGSDGYFGWVIATDSRILWRGGGFVQGNGDLMESLRTESVSLLSLLCLLNRYCEYHGVILRDENTVHYCDNLSLVRRMNWALVKPCTTPGDCLLADYDVQLQIEATLQHMGITLTTRHVKGHQDEDDPHLKWEARLNIAADKLATKARHRIKPKNRNESFHYLPACNAYLLINNKVITRQHQKEIRNAWYTPELQKHLRRKFKWTSKTIKDIDWESVGRIRTGQDFYTRRFVVRFTFERLPLLGAKYTGATNKICPICKQENEDASHFLQCSQNPESLQSLILPLRRIYLNNNIDPALRLLLNAAIIMKPIGRVKIENPTIKWTDYNDLIHRQASLGWKQVLYGRFSLAWDEYQRRYEEAMDIISPPLNIWLGQVVTSVWNGIRLRWKARNSVVHNKQEKDRYRLQKDQLFQRISRLYEDQDKLLAQDRHPFTSPLQEWQNRSITQMRYWLTVNQQYIKHCVILQEQHSQEHTKDIRTYGTPRPRDPNTTVLSPASTPPASKKFLQESISTFLVPAQAPKKDGEPSIKQPSLKFRRKAPQQGLATPSKVQPKIWEHFTSIPRASQSPNLE